VEEPGAPLLRRRNDHGMGRSDRGRSVRAGLDQIYQIKNNFPGSFFNTFKQTVVEIFLTDFDLTKVTTSGVVKERDEIFYSCPFVSPE
jgi:hypothetical protein